MFNIAIKEGVVDPKNYPFGGEEEIERIEALDLELGTMIWRSRNEWLFEFYFTGIRITEVLKMKMVGF